MSLITKSVPPVIHKLSRTKLGILCKAWTHTTVKTLLSNGISRRKIAEQLGIHHRVIKRIERDLSSGSTRAGYQREKLLASFESQVKDFLSVGLTAELIHQKQVKEHSLSVSYATVSRFVRYLKADPESFVPMLSAAGEEAQVDFGYLGIFDREDGRKVKIWVFCIVLSHSRLGYVSSFSSKPTTYSFIL